TERQRERTRPSLTDALLRVLVENGQNLSQLADHEALTVAITFRGQTLCQSCHGVTTGFGTASSRGLDSSMMGSMMPGGAGMMLPGSPEGMVPGGPGQGMPGGPGMAVGGLMPGSSGSLRPSGMSGMSGLPAGGMGVPQGPGTGRPSDASSVSSPTATTTGTA